MPIMLLGMKLTDWFIPALLSARNDFCILTKMLLLLSINNFFFLQTSNSFNFNYWFFEGHRIDYLVLIVIDRNNFAAISFIMQYNIAYSDVNIAGYNYIKVYFCTLEIILAVRCK